MKPVDVYQMEPINVTKEIWCLEKHIRDEVSCYDSNFSLNEKVEVRYYADYCFDGKRVWCFYSVWFEGTPVMICQEAGRVGEDHVNSFITNKMAYNSMITYLRSLGEEQEQRLPLYEEEEEIEEMGMFYGYELSDFYNPSLNPPYQKGDIVNAMVAIEKKGGYIFRDTPMMLTKVQITNVDPVNPHETYQAIELERQMVGEYDWKTQNDTRQIIPLEEGQEPVGKRMYCRLNANLVQIS